MYADKIHFMKRTALELTVNSCRDFIQDSIECTGEDGW